MTPPRTTQPGPESLSPPWGGVETPSLLEPEYADAYHAYRKTGTPQAADALLTAVRPVLDESLRSYAGSEARTGTALANAKRLALQAAARYDPSRAKFRTHLLSHLRGLRRVTERSTAGAYVPEQWRIDAQRIARHETDLRDELGREPSDGELADATSIPVARVRKARVVPGVLASSQYEGGLQLSSPDERAWNSWVESIYHDLQPLDQVILEHSFGLHGRPALQANDIAKMVNLSPGAVSQRKARIQAQLDEYDTFLGGNR